MLKIYNTLSKQKEIFKPLKPGKIGFYVCGVTVYDYCHIGHARVYLVFDCIMRYLRKLGFEVTYIRNITDIDDKIIKRAAENQEPIAALTQRFIQAMHQDFEALNIISPTQEPRATEYIGPMIQMIQTLIDLNYAYIASNGDVYYKVDQFKSYGCLSHRTLEALQAGARIEINEAKHNPLDFVLWKRVTVDEPHWESPFGPGRPGWHIECSAMALQTLGKSLDIHGGGPDLKFPHHENERAQSEAATHQTFVNYWMHVGFVQQNKEKMSKSLDNFLTIRDFLAHYDPEVLRLFAIGSHYRSPVDYTLDNLDIALKGLERLYIALRGVALLDEMPSNTTFEARFNEAMQDDFNTPAALAVLFELSKELNACKETDPLKASTLGSLLKKLANILGLLFQNSEDFLQNLNGKSIQVEEIEALIQEREQARLSKDWAKSDRIREALLARGIALEDTASGTLWHSVS